MEAKFLVAALVGIFIFAIALYVLVIGSGGNAGQSYPDSRCAVSLCDCKCYLKENAANVTASGEVCANNCKAWTGVKGCSYSNGKCAEIK